MGGFARPEREPADTGPCVVGPAPQSHRILTMAEALLICRGFDLGGAHVPPFDVRPGGVVTLQLPARFGAADLLAADLSGAVPRAEIEFHGRCVTAERAQPPAGWRRWFSDPTPAEWLTRRGFARDEAAAVLARHHID